MNIEFLATVAMIAPDPASSRKLYVDALGLSLEGEDDEYLTGSRSPAANHLGSGRSLRPRWAASELISGLQSDRYHRSASSSTSPTPPWSLLPQGNSSGQAHELLHGPREEPWGQTVARLQSPEGAIVGISYAPLLHD